MQALGATCHAFRELWKSRHCESVMSADGVLYDLAGWEHRRFHELEDACSAFAGRVFFAFSKLDAEPPVIWKYRITVVVTAGQLGYLCRLDGRDRNMLGKLFGDGLAWLTSAWYDRLGHHARVFSVLVSPYARDLTASEMEALEALVWHVPRHFVDHASYEEPSSFESTAWVTGAYGSRRPLPWLLEPGNMHIEVLPAHP